MGLHQLGVAAEPGYATFQTPDRFYEFTQEGLDRNNRTLQSDGIRAGGRQLRRSSRRVLLGHAGAGNVNLELGPDLIGIWLEHLLGQVTTTQPDATNAPNVYEHAFEIASLLGKSLTVQKGVEREDGTVEPFTFLGCKVNQATIGVSVDGYATGSFDLDARQVDTDTHPLAAATYVDGPLFHFGQASLLLDGAAVANVSSVELTLNNNLNTERYFLNQSGLKSEPKDDGFPEVTGTAEAEFVSQAALYDAFAADTPLTFKLQFIGDVIETTFNEELSIEIAEIKLDGQAPQVSDPGIASQSVGFTGFYDGVTTGISALLRNSDATA